MRLVWPRRARFAGGAIQVTADTRCGMLRPGDRRKQILGGRTSCAEDHFPSNLEPWRDEEIQISVV